MSSEGNSDLSRRKFIGRSLLAGGTLLTTNTPSTSAAEPTSQTPTPAAAIAKTSPGELPRCILGRTGVSVTRLALGTAPCGSRTPREIAALVNVALDEGVNFIDTSERYGNSQEGVGLGLGSRRKDVFLATKVFANNLKDAEKSLADSIRLLKTDHFDLLYYHGLGCLDIQGAMDPDGVFSWLIKQKKASKVDARLGVPRTGDPVRTEHTGRGGREPRHLRRRPTTAECTEGEGLPPAVLRRGTQARGTWPPACTEVGRTPRSSDRSRTATCPDQLDPHVN